MRLIPILVSATVAGALISSPAAQAAPRKPAKPYDFNGDGRRDKAQSNPLATVKKVKRAGTVTVTYARKKAKRQVLSRASKGVPGRPDSMNPFGGSLASADFDRDGYADLAVSSTPHYGGSSKDTVIVYGGRKGLTSRTLRLHANGDLFVTDFARNERPDLVVFGSGSYTVYQDLRTRPKKGVTQKFNAFRYGNFDSEVSLHIADFTGDRRPDLAVVADTSEGLAPFNPVLLRVSSKSGLGPLRKLAPAVNPSAVRDVDEDGRADLVATRPKADPPDGPPSGELLVYLGDKKGLRTPVAVKGVFPLDDVDFSGL